jgi:RNA polymerase-binding transcription factor DksA
MARHPVENQAVSRRDPAKSRRKKKETNARPDRSSGPKVGNVRSPKVHSPGECLLCGIQIEPARLEALPQTNVCVGCSDKKGGQTKRTIAEPWGTRSDWKKDSGANFARAARPKI